MEKIKMLGAMMRLARFKGAAKKKTTDAEYELIRAKAFKTLEKRFE